MEKTNRQFEEAITLCRELFVKKMTDYGSAWRILRTTSLTDQIFIKANRIRSIEQKGEQKISEGIRDEFIGIVNYSVMALIQLELGDSQHIDMEPSETLKFYDQHIYAAMSLMLDKNHDYDEAWRQMRISSFTDIILMKLLRVKQIEDNMGKTLVSEGLAANYSDIINYSLFALIKIAEAKNTEF